MTVQGVFSRPSRVPPFPDTFICKNPRIEAPESHKEELRWGMAVLMESGREERSLVNKYHIYSLVGENEQADMARDSGTEPGRPNSQARTGTWKIPLTPFSGPRHVRLATTPD